MSAKLKIFDPMMFPNDTSSAPDNADVILTAASGNEVPNATTVKPMMSEDILKNFAMEDAPSTKKSAPLTKITKPANKSMNAQNNVISVNSFFLTLTIIQQIDIFRHSKTKKRLPKFLDNLSTDYFLLTNTFLRFANLGSPSTSGALSSPWMSGNA